MSFSREPLSSFRHITPSRRQFRQQPLGLAKGMAQQR